MTKTWTEQSGSLHSCLHCCVILSALNTIFMTYSLIGKKIITIDIWGLMFRSSSSNYIFSFWTLYVNIFTHFSNCVCYLKLGSAASDKKKQTQNNSNTKKKEFMSHVKGIQAGRRVYPNRQRPKFPPSCSLTILGIWLFCLWPKWPSKWHPYSVHQNKEKGRNRLWRYSWESQMTLIFTS